MVSSLGPSCFPHTHIQSSFSFWTSRGASTKSRPLKRMRPPVTTLAVPQNRTYASVSVHVSPEEEGEHVRELLLLNVLSYVDWSHLTVFPIFTSSNLQTSLLLFILCGRVTSSLHGHTFLLCTHTHYTLITQINWADHLH